MLILGQMNIRRSITWIDIFNRWLARGCHHSYAAYKADQWQARKAHEEKRNGLVGSTARNCE